MLGQSQDIQISKEGIKISYQRLIADSAAGYILAGFFVFEYVSGSLPITPVAEITVEVRVFLLTVVFVLATPIGLAVNAMSWLFLGWLVIFVEALILWSSASGNKMLNFLVHIPIFFPTDTTISYDNSKSFVGIESKKFLGRIELVARLDNVLNVFHAYIPESIGYLAGLEILFRNIAFLAPFLVIFLVYRDNIPLSSSVLSVVVVLICVISVLFSGAIAYYRATRIVTATHAICLGQGRLLANSIRGNIECIEDCLISASK